MTYLLDANVLIARVIPDHIHHDLAVGWLRQNPSFAVCPITEGALVRAIYRSRADARSFAPAMLGAISKHPGYEFWPDKLSYSAVDFSRISGAQQVTDAYLVALAESRSGALVTLDRALAALHPSAVLLTDFT